MPTRGASPSPGTCGRVCGPWPRREPWPPRPSPWKGRSPCVPGCARLSAEPQPRCGGARDGVQRRQDTLVPRERQAPDGRQEGGSPPTDSSVSTRRLFLAPALPMDHVPPRGQHNEDTLTSLLTQLLTLEVISTPGLRCRRKPQRRRSVGCRQSAAGRC